MAAKTLAPVLFLSHGGGPIFFMKDMGGFGGPDTLLVSKAYRSLAKQVLAVNGLKEKPTAIVVISAHWEESDAVHITSAAAPGLLYDYYGFPEDTYAPHLTYDCPGQPQLAERVHSLLSGQGIHTKLDAKRAFDHGVFIPLKLIYPDADIPVVQVSLHSSLSPSFHFKMGQALAPLREENILIIGSGQATHNMRAPRVSNGAKFPWAEEFVGWMKQTLTRGLSAKELEAELARWEQAPGARMAHPREEHLIPLMAAAGAGVTGQPDGHKASLCLDGHMAGHFSLASFIWQ